MMVIMNSITSQHFEISNSAKGFNGSNFTYDEDRKVKGITPKVAEDDGVMYS
jgi:hypothetical protein